MERVKALVETLQEQLKLSATIGQLKETVQKLQIELEAQGNNGNEINAHFSQKESLNDKLKVEKVEVLQSLKKATIHNLHKAIDVNQKFIFIQELFKGDEGLYDKTVREINKFTNYAEAEFWMEEELLSKLKWEKANSQVQQFYGLVKRRFS
ncbi:MAG: hypothetical protein EPO57_06100 [Chitinophagaceae bacterium]|nr:MAG: hypothetical protein EPO57_06100 [Chitinophagaceae bacterium]